MLSKSLKKLISSLSKKKHREEHGLFLAEGEKIVSEFISSGMEPTLLLKTGECELAIPAMGLGFEVLTVTRGEIEGLSMLKTPQHVMALFRLPNYNFNNDAIKNDLVLVLDGIQDPGNLGSITRVAYWFGIFDVICSYDTVDVYNPKVVQASMGSIARVRVHYRDLSSLLPAYYHETGNHVYGTYLEGENIYETNLCNKGLLVMGNEGNGIRPGNSVCITRRLTIPGYPLPGSPTMSLNVAMASAIACGEFRRRLKV